MTDWKRLLAVGLCWLLLFTSPVTAAAVKKPLTLQQAVEVGMKRAMQWNPKAKVANVESTEFPLVRESGEAGKRRLWHEEFGVPGSTEHLRLTVEDGRVQAVHETVGEDVYLDNVNGIDSGEAWSRACAEANLKPGTGVEVGYHYRLFADDQQQALLAVSGSDAQGRPVQVHFSLRDGQKKRVYRKELTGGGLFARGRLVIGTNRGQRPSMYEVEVSPVEDQKLYGFGYSDLTENNRPFAKLSQDRGVHWTELALPNRATRIWWDRSGCLYASGAFTVWRSRDDGKTWETVVYKEQQNTFSVDTQGDKLALLTDEGLHLSKDEGKTWHRADVPSGANRILYQEDGTLYVQTERGLYHQQNGSWEMVSGKTMVKSGGRILCLKEKGFSLLTSEGRKTFAYPNQGVQAERVMYAEGRLYAVCKNKLFTRSLQAGDRWECVSLPDEGLLLDLAVGSDQELYFAFAPRLVWKQQM